MTLTDSQHATYRMDELVTALYEARTHKGRQRIADQLFTLIQDFQDAAINGVNLLLADTETV
ncbi:hypothetical protein ABT282_30905 [Streptomyces sp. NPDC000927]|uniref:hypothetical protein n=1 Tax=Streptomyces sp. NPDC000927 TaxID=3154371 RepID=UPI003327B87E